LTGKPHWADQLRTTDDVSSSDALSTTTISASTGWARANELLMESRHGTIAFARFLVQTTMLSFMAAPVARRGYSRANG
jgi:hypothetical protein